MPQHKDLTDQGVGNDQMNKHILRVMGNYKNTKNAKGHDVQEIRHANPYTGGTRKSLTTDGELMTFTQMLEEMDVIQNSLEFQNDDILNQQIIDTTPNNQSDVVDDQSIINKLNELFTPILINQAYEDNVISSIKESYDEANVFNEQNVIQFDRSKRMAQLISLCSLLLQQQKNTENYQMFIKASKIRNQTKLNMQKEEYNNAKILAQKYLINVTTQNPSAAARDAATNLLPETQH